MEQGNGKNQKAKKIIEHDKYRHPNHKNTKIVYEILVDEDELNQVIENLKKDPHAKHPHTRSIPSIENDEITKITIY